MLTGLIVCSSPSWPVLLAVGVIGQRMSLSCPCVQLRICWTTEARGVAFAKHTYVLGNFSCKYCLFSKHLINVSGGLLMCKWVKALLPLPQHNVCTEAQSCLWRRDSQISRCGAKPVALSTREPLVFNSLSRLSLRPCVCVWNLCVTLCMCGGVWVRYVSKSLICTIVQLVLLYQCPSVHWLMAVHVQLAKRCERHPDSGIVHRVPALTGAYKWANLRIKAPRIQL